MAAAVLSLLDVIAVQLTWHNWALSFWTAFFAGLFALFAPEPWKWWIPLFGRLANRSEKRRHSIKYLGTLRNVGLVTALAVMCGTLVPWLFLSALAESPQELRLLWSHATDSRSQVVAADSERVVLLANSGSVKAFDSLNGNLLWTDKKIMAPISFSGTRVFAVAKDDSTVALDAVSGRVLWQSAIRRPGIPSLAANDNIVLDVIDPKDPGPNMDLPAETIALNAKNGNTLWTYWGSPAAYPRDISFAGPIVIDSYEAQGEPSVGAVEAFDAASGSLRIRSLWAEYRSVIDGNVWLERTDLTPNNEPAAYDRYTMSGKHLDGFVYDPTPRPPSDCNQALVYGARVQTFFSGDYLYFSLCSVLFRYSVHRSPIRQEPMRTNVDGPIIGTVGSALLVNTSDGSRLLLPRSGDEFASKPISSIIEPVRALAHSEQESLFASDGNLVVISETGREAVADSADCSAPSSAAILRSNLFAAVCSSRIAVFGL